MVGDKGEGKREMGDNSFVSKHARAVTKRTYKEARKAGKMKNLLIYFFSLYY